MQNSGYNQPMVSGGYNPGYQPGYQPPMNQGYQHQPMRVINNQNITPTNPEVSLARSCQFCNQHAVSIVEKVAVL
jgi:hypothetical protein